MIKQPHDLQFTQRSLGENLVLKDFFHLFYCDVAVLTSILSLVLSGNNNTVGTRANDIDNLVLSR